jgi:hypothetical protein
MEIDSRTFQNFGKTRLLISHTLLAGDSKLSEVWESNFMPLSLMDCIDVIHPSLLFNFLLEEMLSK